MSWLSAGDSPSDPRLASRCANVWTDPNLLGTVLDGDSWFAWRALLFASQGEQLTDAERAIFQQLTGREHEPDHRVEEFIAVIGRRGGKIRAISRAGHLPSRLGAASMLVPGERGIVLCIAPDQTPEPTSCSTTSRRTSSNRRCCAQLIEARTQRSLKLTNKIDIEVRAANFRTLRGLTLICAIADECAFWYAENSSNPDSEILNGRAPRASHHPRPAVHDQSSPYARRGELWNSLQQALRSQRRPNDPGGAGAIRVMNPSLPQSVVDRAYERDPASADAEYGASSAATSRRSSPRGGARLRQRQCVRARARACRGYRGIC